MFTIHIHVMLSLFSIALNTINYELEIVAEKHGIQMHHLPRSLTWFDHISVDQIVKSW